MVTCVGQRANVPTLHIATMSPLSETFFLNDTSMEVGNYWQGSHRLDKIFFHDNFLIFHDHLSYQFCICCVLQKTSKNVNFLQVTLMLTFLVVAKKNISIWYNSGAKLVKFQD